MDNDPKVLALFYRKEDQRGVPGITTYFMRKILKRLRLNSIFQIGTAKTLRHEKGLTGAPRTRLLVLPLAEGILLLPDRN